jgi:hypothetical protein
MFLVVLLLLKYCFLLVSESVTLVAQNWHHVKVLARCVAVIV